MLGTSKSVWGFDPRSVPGCQLWLDGADSSSMTFSGSTITQWNDKSGNAKNAVSTGTPTYLTGGGVNFNGSSYFLNQTFTMNLSQRSVFIVFQETSRTQYAGIFPLIPTLPERFDQSQTTGLSYATTDNSFQAYGNNSYGLYIGNANPLPKGIYNEIMNITAGSGYLNGTNTTNVTATYTAGTCSGYGLACRWQDGSVFGSLRLNGVIYEIVVYNSALTTSQRQQVEGYLAWKWGLTTYSPVTPLSIPGCQLWLDAADSSTITGTTTVTQWRDKSGNARHLGVGAGTTSYSSNAIQLTNSAMFVTSPVDLSKVTVFIVVKTTGGNNQTVLTGRPNTNVDYNSLDGFGFFMDSTSSIRFYGQEPAGQFSTFSVNTSTPKVFSFQSSGTSVSGWVNGVSQSGGTLSSTRTSTAQGFGIGGQWGGSSYGNFITNATLYEIIVFNSDVTTTQRQGIESYLTKKWFGSSLPSTHPFSSIRPHLRTFQPTDIPGCSLWLDAADSSQVTFSSSSNVNTWIDKSGFNNSSSNQSLGTTITYPGTKVNGLNTVNFTAGCIRGAFNGSSVINTTDVTIFIVTAETAPNDNLRMFSLTTAANYQDDTANTMLVYCAPGNYQLTFYRAGAMPTPYTVTQNVPFIYSLTQTSGTGSMWLNGGSNRTASITTSAFAVTNYNIGTQYLANQNYTGLMCEVVVYNTLLNTSQRQKVEGYLAHKWGLTLSLPVISPLSIPGCQLWLDGADPAGTGVTPSNGATVSTWVDKSGNGYNAAASGTMTIGTLNNIPAIVFPAASTAVFLPPASLSVGTNGYSVFFVANQTSFSSGGTRFYSANSGGVQAFLNNASPPILSLYNGSSISSTFTVVASTPFLYSYTISSSAGGLWKNGTLAGSSGGSTTAISTFYIGNFVPDLVYAFTGQMGEFIIYNSALTTTQRQSIEGYLARKWGISISATLPSPHPFKSILPATAAHFSPTSITGCQLWLDGADPAGITLGTGVSQWTDKSGNAYNLTQSTTGSQPTYASSLVTFASDKYLNIPASVMNNLSTWSLFFVINPISSSNWIITKHKFGVDTYNVLSMTYNTFGSGNLQSGTVSTLYWRSMNAGTQFVSPEPLTTSTLQFCSLTYDGTNLYFYKNGEFNQTTTGTFAIQNQTSPDHYTLGALIYPGGQITNSGVTNFKLGEMIVYNTFLTNSQREQIEGYLAHKWGLTSSLYSTHPYKPLPPIFPPTVQYNITATGGTIVSTVGTTYHVFRNSSTFVVRTAITVNYLIVGGGGGGGDRHGGGGGAGGVLSGTWSASAGTYTVTVGAGGQYGSTNEGGQIAYGTPNGSGTKGGDSVVSGTGISITAYGGGGGGSYDGNPSGTVGSGGGGGGQNLSGVAGTAGQGNAGGSGSNPGAGGGGGAGGAGVAANTGTGGIGTSSFSSHLLAVGYGTTFAVATSPNTVISGGVAYIAGGGGGCAGTSPGPGGSGGLGGGGRGDWADTNITAGTPNTGGGGGGTRSHPDSLQTTGRNGGSGLVLVWY